jgi:hypothetical protein
MSAAAAAAAAVGLLQLSTCSSQVWKAGRQVALQEHLLLLVLPMVLLLGLVGSSLWLGAMVG